MKEPLNGLEPAKSDRLHEAVRDITKRLKSHIVVGDLLRYRLPEDVARNDMMTDFIQRYFTHSELKATLVVKKRVEAYIPLPGTYLFLERVVSK